MDELTHVGKGVKWFKWVCAQEGEEEPVELYCPPPPETRLLIHHECFVSGCVHRRRGKSGMLSCSALCGVAPSQNPPHEV